MARMKQQQSARLRKAGVRIVMSFQARVVLSICGISNSAPKHAFYTNCTGFEAESTGARACAIRRILMLPGGWHNYADSKASIACCQRLKDHKHALQQANRKQPRQLCSTNVAAYIIRNRKQRGRAKTH
eukprot:TRINITY_DN11836_c0_g1_i1.p3 TRINITY_DN11836_c0_g1~~TRINITY_DN11836_c0_g1_i1.p3  ORF type:complete len:129 (+),score=3.66 TRINITY_DN11836_c0_g1_i1:116-502(+)